MNWVAIQCESNTITVPFFLGGGGMYSYACKHLRWTSASDVRMQRYIIIGNFKFANFFLYYIINEVWNQFFPENTWSLDIMFFSQCVWIQFVRFIPLISHRLRCKHMRTEWKHPIKIASFYKHGNFSSIMML